MTRCLRITAAATFAVWSARAQLAHATVDVVVQLHRLQQAAASHTAAPIVLENVPSTLSQRLADRQLRWLELSALQQRALLWDAGLVLAADGRLLQVYVRCNSSSNSRGGGGGGATMNQVFLPTVALEAVCVTTRETTACTNAVDSVNPASALAFVRVSRCPLSVLQRVTQCAIEDSDSPVTIVTDAMPTAAQVAVTQTAATTPTTMELRLRGASDVASVPNIRVYRHDQVAISSSGSATTTTNASSPTLFTIHEQPLALPGAASDCDLGFVVPCVQRVVASSAAWCLPARGGYLDLWLDAERSGASAAATTGPTARMGTSTVLLLVLLGVLALAAVLTVARMFKRRASRSKCLTVATLLDSDDDIPRLSAGEHRCVRPHQPVWHQVEQQQVLLQCTDDETRYSIPALLSASAQLSTTPSGASMVRPLPVTLSLRTGAAVVFSPPSHASSSNSLASDIDALNESMYRRSIKVLAFCGDRALLARRIAYRQLTFTVLLARGANGEVWKGEVRGAVVAIKQLVQEKRHDASAIEQFAKEIRLASRLEHPNIVRFMGFSWHRLADLCSVSEFMGRGDLSDLITSTLSGRMTWDHEKLAIAVDIANALGYLHTLAPVIIHRDLKSLNVLLNDALEAKLSDFGLSRARSFEETMTCGIGTLLWTAPEILRGEAYTEKADIFSYGIVLSELDTCLPPYALNDEVSRQQLTNMQLINLVAKGHVVPRFRGDCPVALERLALACVAPDPAKRPSAMEVVLALTSKAISAPVR